jgi:hypothetical protein
VYLEWGDGVLGRTVGGSPNAVMGIHEYGTSSAGLWTWEDGNWFAVWEKAE